MKDITPHLREERGESVLSYDPEDAISFYSYIVLDNDPYYIKDMSKVGMARKVAQLHSGDILSIKGLGDLIIVSVFYDTKVDGVHSFEEIGLYCEKVVS